MLGKSTMLAEKARKAGIKVFHVPIMFKEDASDNPNKGLGILAGCAGNKLFTEGASLAESISLCQNRCLSSILSRRHLERRLP